MIFRDCMYLFYISHLIFSKMFCPFLKRNLLSLFYNTFFKKLSFRNHPTEFLKFKRQTKRTYCFFVCYFRNIESICSWDFEAVNSKCCNTFNPNYRPNQKLLIEFSSHAFNWIQFKCQNLFRVWNPLLINEKVFLQKY